MRLTRRGRDGDRPGCRVFLHLGAPVTGSAHVRDALARHRRRLARTGVLYPGSHVGGPGHLDAVLDVLDLSDGTRAVDGAWDRLTQTVRDWRRGTVVLSHELLADADDGQVQRVLGGLAPAEVHVVHAVRELSRHLPLAWQEWVRNGGTATFSSYVAAVAARTGSPEAEVFWRSHDVAGVLGRWAAYVPDERVHVLTVPDGPDQERVLWERLCAVVGVDSRRLRTPASAPALLPLAALESLRLLNLETGGPPPASVLAAASTLTGLPPAVGAVHAPWLRDEAERTVTAVKDAGWGVTGDLTDLRPGTAPGATGPQVEPPVDDVLTAQTRLMAALAVPAPAPVSRSRLHVRRPAGR